VEDGSGAHGAGFEGDVEGAVGLRVKAVVLEGLTGGSEGDDFGVCGGVVIAEDAVLAGGDDLVLVDDDCAYGDFAGASAACASAMAARR